MLKTSSILIRSRYKLPLKILRKCFRKICLKNIGTFWRIYCLSYCTWIIKALRYHILNIDDEGVTVCSDLRCWQRHYSTPNGTGLLQYAVLCSCFSKKKENLEMPTKHQQAQHLTTRIYGTLKQARPLKKKKKKRDQKVKIATIFLTLKRWLFDKDKQLGNVSTSSHKYLEYNLFLVPHPVLHPRRASPDEFISQIGYPRSLKFGTITRRLRPCSVWWPALVDPNLRRPEQLRCTKFHQKQKVEEAQIPVLDNMISRQKKMRAKSSRKVLSATWTQKIWSSVKNSALRLDDFSPWKTPTKESEWAIQSQEMRLYLS